MGRKDIHVGHTPEELRRFEERLLADADAFEQLLAEERFETGVRRIGLEQELFLIDEHGRPVGRAMEVLKSLGGPGTLYQPELARFNVEVALEPLLFEGDCLTRLERELRKHLAAVQRAAQHHGVDAVAIGILPTLGWEHLGLDWMTPLPRYAEINRTMRALRGGDFRIQIRGTDTLHATHDNLMLESFNTSFQLHMQVDPDEFAPMYNAMQLASGVVLAAAGNSPLLLGLRLWEETRIALFRQSVDMRSDHHQARGSRERVFFGDRWVKESVLELVRDDITHFRVILPLDDDEPWPAEVLARGEIPSLKALAMHNGTVYRWNRPVYGVFEGRPTLRIENRPLPAGPTVLDGLANLSFLFGLTLGLVEEFGDVGKKMPFHDCQANFFNAASTGLRAALHWLDGRTRPADELVLQLLPLAAKGLETAGIAADDANRYLDILAGRVASGQTGSRWLLEGFNRLHALVPRDEALQGITRDYVLRQRTTRPVHSWKPAAKPERQSRRAAYETVGQVMHRDLKTVQEEDAVRLAEAMMRWEGIRHIPVENAEGELVGLVTLSELLEALKAGKTVGDVHIGDIMRRDVRTVSASTRTLEAIRILREEKLSCLPVVRDGKLIGMLTSADFLVVSARLLE